MQLLQTLDLLAALHGTVVSTWLLAAAWRGRNRPQAWFAVVLLTFSLELINAALLDYKPLDWIAVQPLGLPLNGYFMLPLALWSYAMCLLRPSYRLHPVWWVLPIAEASTMAALLAVPALQRTAMLSAGVGVLFLPAYLLGQTVFMVGWLARLLHYLLITAPTPPPQADEAQFRLQRRWLLVLCGLLAANYLLWLPQLLLHESSAAAKVLYTLNTLLTTGMVYHMGIRILTDAKLSTSLQLRAALLPAGVQLAQQAKQLLVGKALYLDPELNLDKFASALQAHPRTLSKALNDYLGKGFPQLVNELRVQAAQQLLADPGNDHLNIVWLGEMAGFPSKSSFNEVFRRITGMTPSQYRQQSRAGKGVK